MDTNDTDVAGVAYIQYYFAHFFNWTLRTRTPIDVGIDADVEQKTNDIYTGKHIALQIKSGKSYLKVKKNGKISFIIDEWHYKYWADSDRPVLLLFFDGENQNIIWEEVKHSNIQKTTKNHLIEVLPTKILSKESISELEDIIHNFTPRNLDIIDLEDITLDYALYCFRDANTSAKEVNTCFEFFRQELTKQIYTPNPAIFENVFKTAQKRLVSSSALFTQKYISSCKYIVKMIPTEDKQGLINLVDQNYKVIQTHIEIWTSNVKYLSKVNHPNFPYTVQRAGNNFITTVNDYIYELESIASFLLSIKSQLLT